MIGHCGDQFMLRGQLIAMGCFPHFEASSGDFIMSLPNPPTGARSICSAGGTGATREAMLRAPFLKDFCSGLIINKKRMASKKPSAGSRFQNTATRVGAGVAGRGAARPQFRASGLLPPACSANSQRKWSCTPISPPGHKPGSQNRVCHP